MQFFQLKFGDDKNNTKSGTDVIKKVYQKLTFNKRYSREKKKLEDLC